MMESTIQSNATLPGPDCPQASASGTMPVRLLLDGPTRMDTQTLQLIRAIPTTSLPRNMGTIPRWTDLVAFEIADILQMNGDSAFSPMPSFPDGMLVRHYSADGTETAALTAKAQAALRDRLTGKWFRQVLTDHDNLPREYLICRIRVGRGHQEVRLSWYGSASPLIDGQEPTQLHGMEFEDLTPEQQRKANAYRRWLGTLRDARDLLDVLVRVFGRDGDNPVVVPAQDLRQMLGCETSEDGHSRLLGALRALQELRFEIKGKGVSFGAMVGDTHYEGRGAGKHTAGIFKISLSGLAIGCLRLFKAEEQPTPGVEHYQWNQKLKKGEKEERPKLNFVTSHSTLWPAYDRLKNFTPAQQQLRDWIDHNLTLRRDRTAKGRQHLVVASNAADATEPRNYTTDFCPLLAPGCTYHAALGHFKNNPECGWKLHGRSKTGKHSNGAKGDLLDTLGIPHSDHSSTATTALADLRAVVEDALGGRALGRLHGKWLTLDQAADLKASRLLTQVAWFLFVPSDWLNCKRRLKICTSASPGMAAENLNT